jgi:hypothetical protein
MTGLRLRCLEPSEDRHASNLLQGSPTLLGKQTQFFFRKNWPLAPLLTRFRSARDFSYKCPKGRSVAELCRKGPCTEVPTSATPVPNQGGSKTWNQRGTSGSSSKGGSK